MSFKPTRLDVLSDRRVHYDVTVPEGVSLDDVLRPDFWAHVGGTLRPRYLITVDAADGSWMATLMVRSSQRQIGASVVKIAYYDLAAADKEAEKLAKDNTLKAVWKGPVLKHCVQRQSDGVLIAQRLDTKAEAEAFVASQTTTAKAA